MCWECRRVAFVVMVLPVLDGGLCFPVVYVGVYQSFVDGEVGGWELVKFVLYSFVGC